MTMRHAHLLVAAQWAVSDAVTLLLMHRFCIGLLAGRDAAGSLADAQRWLGQAGNDSIVDAIDQLQNALGENEPRSLRLLNDLREETLESGAPVPFADPSYWAAFVCVGA